MSVQTEFARVETSAPAARLSIETPAEKQSPRISRANPSNPSIPPGCIFL
ncbi:MAG: hypothetical protein WA789_12445 [Candidatus Acidiferrum sp.]